MHESCRPTEKQTRKTHSVRIQMYKPVGVKYWYNYSLTHCGLFIQQSNVVLHTSPPLPLAHRTRPVLAPSPPTVVQDRMWPIARSRGFSPCTTSIQQCCWGSITSSWGPLWETRRHPLDRKYTTYYNAIKGPSSHSYWQREQEIWWSLELWFWRYACARQSVSVLVSVSVSASWNASLTAQQKLQTFNVLSTLLLPHLIFLLDVWSSYSVSVNRLC